MYLQKLKSEKQKNVFFWHIEGQRQKLQDPDPHPDPLVRGMDPRIQIRIRIHTKMSWIRNTVTLYIQYILDRGVPRILPGGMHIFG
jgi:hypothetical protein